MFILQQIHATATAKPRKLALVFNGAPVTIPILEDLTGPDGSKVAEPIRALV